MKRNSPGDCSSCTERWFCKELCPDAERIIGQDYIPQNSNEHLAGSLYPKPLPHVDALIYLTPSEVKIVRYFGAGLIRKEIAMILEINRNTLRSHIYNIKRKHGVKRID